MSAEEHKAHAPESVRVYVVTISDTRTVETDTSGRLAQQMVAEWGHQVSGYRIVKDDPEQVIELLRIIAAEHQTDVVVTTGGTGISRRDSTYEAVTRLLDKRLDGFGELFRMLSYADIGSAAMMSRAVAGLYAGIVVFSLPGSAKAVKLGLEKLILPELGHLAFEKGR